MGSELNLKAVPIAGVELHERWNLRRLQLEGIYVYAYQHGLSTEPLNHKMLNL